MSVAFGDNVRIVDVALTRDLGFAGLRGQVYGITTLSVTGVAVVGSSASDRAINVHFEDRNESAWFEPGLVELIDHAAGTEIRLDGVSKKWARSADGSWNEHDTKKRPWWKFW